MRSTFSLNDIKSLHDAISVFEEMSTDEPEEYPEKEHYTSLRKRLKDMIDYIEQKTMIEIEITAKII